MELNIVTLPKETNVAFGLRASPGVSPLEETAAGEPKYVPSSKPVTVSPLKDPRALTEHLNQQLKDVSMEARYSIDDKTNQVIIRIVNSTSGELLRQIPDEYAVRMADAMANTEHAAMTNLVDEKV